MSTAPPSNGRRVPTWAEEVAAWAAPLDLVDVPEPVIERARLQLASTLAAGRAGATAGAVQRLREATREWARTGPCTVVGRRFKLEPAAATYANAAASIAHDWDDYLYMGHTGHSAVWASRAVAEAVGAQADEALAAQIAANEVEGRLGAALFLGPHNGQFWSSIHCAGAAVAAGKLMGLDVERLAHTLAIALYQPPYGLWPGFMGPDTKLLTAAEPAAQGVRAAQLAKARFSGPLDVVESPRGLLVHLAFAPQPAMLKGLGDVWLTDTLAYKPYPGCAYLQSAVEGLLRLREAEAFDAGEIAAVEVEGGYLTAGMEKLAEGPALTPVRVNFSVALSAAVALTARRLTHRELDEAWLLERERWLRELAARVRVKHDWDLTLASVRGIAEAVPLAELVAGVSLSRWRSVRRRLHELSMDDLDLGLGDLRDLLRRADVRRALSELLRNRFSGDRKRWARDGLAALDTARMRMSFPAQIRLRLRCGRVLETEGREPGSCGSPLAEQRAVVAAKWATTGGDRERLAELGEAAWVAA